MAYPPTPAPTQDLEQTFRNACYALEQKQIDVPGGLGDFLPIT